MSVTLFENLRHCRQWWKTWKTLPILPWIKGAVFFRAGKYQLAIKSYEKGIKNYKKHPARYCARMDLAYCLFKEKKFEEAEKHLKYVISALPRSKEAYIRLAKLQIWIGHSLDAAWTIRRALNTLPLSAELAELFLYAVLDNGGPPFLLQEAVQAVTALSKEERQEKSLLAVRARFLLTRGKKEKALKVLEKIVSEEAPAFDSLLIYAGELLEDNQVERARIFLHRALKKSPEHPRVLSLLAESYLKSGSNYNAEYALQLATQACQSSKWLSPREMHILAEAYYHQSDKMSALIIATRARQEGDRLLGTYPQSAVLDQLIDNIESGTLG